MNYKDKIQKFLGILIDANPNALIDPLDYLRHIGHVQSLAEKLVDNITERNPGFRLNKQQISLAAGLHDVGKLIKPKSRIHEIAGAMYIERNGINIFKNYLGLDDSIDGGEIDQGYISRVAQMIKSHGFTLEHWLDPLNFNDRREFTNVDPIQLFPRTWEEAILTYCDFASLDGERIDVSEKIENAIKRYTCDPAIKNIAVVRSILSGKERILKLAEKIEALEQGNLPEPEKIYGFL